MVSGANTQSKYEKEWEVKYPQTKTTLLKYQSSITEIKVIDRPYKNIELRNGHPSPHRRRHQPSDLGTGIFWHVEWRLAERLQVSGQIAIHRGSFRTASVSCGINRGFILSNIQNSLFFGGIYQRLLCSAHVNANGNDNEDQILLFKQQPSPTVVNIVSCRPAKDINRNSVTLEPNKHLSENLPRFD